MVPAEIVLERKGSGHWRERESEYSRYRGLVTRDNLILSG